MGDSDGEVFHLSEYERGVDLATPSTTVKNPSIQRQVSRFFVRLFNPEQINRIYIKRSLNESNEIVETLRHENAGLKETINRMEMVSAKSPEKSSKKNASKNTKKDNLEEIQGLNAALEKRFVF